MNLLLIIDLSKHEEKVRDKEKEVRNRTSFT
jgi:hypothetical protein